MCEAVEQVRLPGIINMELEASKLIEDSLQSESEGREEKTFHLNIPLQISVDTKALSTRSLFSPAAGKLWCVSKERGRVPGTLESRSRTPSGRVRSASAGRDNNHEMAARYWAVLFENLRRSVDDLYRTCEGDESCVAAKEVLMVLENYVKDFKNLINWLKLKTEYEKTPLPQRPTSLAWDIRKTSPAGKLTPTGGSGKMTPTRQLILCSPAKRQLDFDEKEENRDRKISETIREAHVEMDSSPEDVSYAVNPLVINLEDIETDANVSEHEKSDSEQEKDAVSDSSPTHEEEKDAVSDSSPTHKEEKDAVSDSSPTHEKEKDLVSDSSPTHEKVSDTLPDTRESEVAAREDDGTSGVAAADAVAAPTDNEEERKTEDSSQAKSKKSDATESSVEEKKMNKILEKSLEKLSKTDKLKSTEKPLDKYKPSRDPTLASGKTTFASTLKGWGKATPARTGVPTMTRALTTISPAAYCRPSAVSLATRRSNAGLLITSQKLQPTLNRQTTRTHPPRSPKQHRISLVARQSQFAQTTKAGSYGGAQAKEKSMHQEANPPPRLNKQSQGSNSSVNSGGSSRSWAETVKDLVLDGSREEVRRGEDEEEEEGWFTVRRTRSKFSPASTGSNGSVRTQSRQLYRAKNRYKMPSSAVSMPSLASEHKFEAEADCGNFTEDTRFVPPTLEKSASSASIVRNKDARVSRLGSVSEKACVGSSVESLTAADPSVIKKKKDQVNQTKQKALKKSSDPTSSASKQTKPKTRKSNSVPLVDGVLTWDDEKISRESPDLCQDTETDTDSEDIQQRDAAIAKAEQEAENLQREIQETEQAELTDTDVEIDATEAESTEADTTETESFLGVGSGIESMFEGLSWAEQMELEEQLAESTESRYPGRAIHLHEKLSSPARKKEPHETFRHYQEKQDKAKFRRQMFSEEKANKLALLNQRIGEVLDQRDRLVEERKAMIENKLKKAEEKRIQHIEGIRRKAHEEEEKLKEIAFINELQAQNTRIDMITQVSTADEKCEERLAELAGERAKKAEQREEREARAEERRRVLEEERQRHLDAMIERRREREERIQGSQAAAREKRKVSAIQKDRERLERLSTVRAAEKDMKEELQEKIQQKQEDAAKRHAEYLEDIRQKAFELSVQKCSNDEGVPVIQPYQTKKKCEVCNVLIKSEVHLQSHLRGKHHAEEINKKTEGKDLSGAEITDYNLKHIVDAPEGETDPNVVKARERVKAVKKRAKKLKTKMALKGEEYMQSLPLPNKHTDSPNRAKIGKSVRDMEKLLANQGKGAWPNNAVSLMERALGEICRSFDKNHGKDQDVFFALGGFDVLGKIYDKLLESKGGNSCAIPIKSLVSTGRVLLKASAGHAANSEFLLLSNRVSVFVEILRDQLTRLVPEPGMGLDLELSTGPDTDPLSQSLMQFLSAFILQLTANNKLCQASRARLQDLVSYIVSIEIVDYLARYFQLVRNPIDSSPEVAECLLVALQFLSALSRAAEISSVAEDPTQLLSTLQWTELAGTVSLLYGMLLHQGRDTAREFSPTPLPPHTLAVATETCTLLHRLVKQNLSMVQCVLASEGISLEFRHIASYLLWYSQCHNQTMLLNQVITLVGYFTANHADNQAIVQAGSQPSVLQQLANLPFQYFSTPELKHVLFPTLLACCHQNSVNMNILTRELSWNLIEDFIITKEAEESHLVQMILKKTT